MQEESLTTPHPIVIWSCDSHVISCDLTYDDASCQIDLTLADIPGTTEQLNNAFGFRHTETLKVYRRRGGREKKHPVDSSFFMQVSAKLGTGVEELIAAVIERISW